LVSAPTSSPKRSGDVARGIIIASIICLFASMNLDVPAGYLSSHDDLLEAAFCYQIMTAVNTMVGVRDWRLATAWSQLANCYSRLGRDKDAVAASRQARKIIAKIYSETNVNVAIADAQIGQFLCRDKDYVAAEEVLKHSLKQLENDKTATAASKAYVLSNLVDTYMGAKKYADAEPLAKQLVALDDELSAVKTKGYGGRTSLAELYCRTGRIAEADEVARTALTLSQTDKDMHDETTAHDSLGRVLLCAGRSQDAKSEFDAAVACLAVRYGKTADRVLSWRARYEQMLKDKIAFPE
jgi:tetratricopeptide (TPR) repeat protein